MIRQPDCYRRYDSARARFLRPVLIKFFERELPKFFGPILRERYVDELLRLFDSVAVPRDYVAPGQVVWCAVDKATRPDSPRCKIIPVVLTVIDERDCEQLSKGTSMTEIAANAIARITREAHAQGALLSMRDIGLLTWRSTGGITPLRRAYEEQHKVTLPHTGSLQDMGSCISHKNIILEKLILQKKPPRVVAQETSHTLWAVERYHNDFRRVQQCYEKDQSLEFIVGATGIAKHVVMQHIEIIKKLDP